MKILIIEDEFKTAACLAKGLAEVVAVRTKVHPVFVLTGGAAADLMLALTTSPSPP